MKKTKLVDLRDIKIRDQFWQKHTSLVKREILEYQWEAMNDRIEGAPRSHCIQNFRIAAGEADGEFYGAVFQDSDLAKWLEAVAYVLADEPDQALKDRADEVIRLIGKAQQADGYFNTYFILKEPEKRFQNLCEGHELYTLGHMIEAAVAYFQATGERSFLEIVCRMADLIAETFGPDNDQLHGMPGHQEIELALIRLYEITEKKHYLQTAKYFIDVRGERDNYFIRERKQEGYHSIFPEFADYQPEYSQSHLPVRQQDTAEGHAVRAVYMYCAMADLAAEFDDQELLTACRKLWENIVNRRMYITGSIGSSGILERFTTDYDLPNDINYSETCASIGLALFGRRMSQICQDASFIDTVERALFNTLLAGIALDGKSFFYVNPLEVWPPNCMERTSREHVKNNRQKWFGVACCPPNIARTLASLGQYIYAYEEDTLFVNLLIGNQAKIPLQSGIVEASLTSEFPRLDQYQLVISGDVKELTLAIRVPEYAEGYRICIADQEQQLLIRKGYAYLTGDLCGREIRISYRTTAHFVRANPSVPADVGKVCLVKGAQVYALEEVDNGAGLSGIFVDTSAPIQECWEEELFRGSMTLKAKGFRINQEAWRGELYGEHPVSLQPVTLKAIPYAYWNNRGEGEMAVWIKEKL